MRKHLSTAAALLALALGARAQDCSGDPGWVLNAPTTIPIGTSFDVCMTGPADEMGLLMVSEGQGPIYSKKYGWICLDFPTLFDIPFTLDATGSYCFTADIDCDPGLVGITVYSQFLTCKPNPGISNQVASTIVDNVCSGDLGTFTNGGWGAKCKGGNAGCRLDASFASLFPTGLVIGDADGIDSDSTYALTFSSSTAVRNFLPGKGTAGILAADAANPTDSAAGVFAGQLVAAKLNLAFDDAGLLDDIKARDDLKLGDLVYVAGVDSDLIGWSVRDVIDLADQAISGALGSGGIDLDGDTIADLTVADLSAALSVLNLNFDNGTSNDGNLGIP